MKKLLSILVLVVFLPFGLMTVTSCQLDPNTHNVSVQTLKAVGQSAEVSMQLAGQLYQSGRILSGDLIAVANFYDGTFQPAFRTAVATVNGDVNAVAPADLVSLSTQLAAIVYNLSHR